MALHPAFFLGRWDVMFVFLGWFYTAYKILIPQPGIESGDPYIGNGASTGLPEKSLALHPGFTI